MKNRGLVLVIVLMLMVVFAAGCPADEGSENDSSEVENTTEPVESVPVSDPEPEPEPEPENPIITQLISDGTISADADVYSVIPFEGSLVEKALETESEEDRVAMSQNATVIGVSSDGYAMHVVAYSQIPESDLVSSMTEDDLDKPFRFFYENDDGALLSAPYKVLID